MGPPGMATVGTGGFIQSRPTQESLDGATVGTENVSVAGAPVSAKHVKFGAGGGNLEWWISDQVPGGWVKFSITNGDKTQGYVIEMAEKGTGAKSELGIKP